MNKITYAFLIAFFSLILLNPHAYASDPIQEAEYISPEVKSYIIQYYLDNNAETYKEMFKKHRLRICNHYIQLDFNSAADGMLYYLRKDTGVLYARCGGVCRSANDAQREECETTCLNGSHDCNP